MLCGLTYGLCYTVVPMYLGEISSDKIRGGITIMLTVMVKLGILITYSVGPYVSFHTLPWINLAAPGLFLMLVYWVPETPYYLLDTNKPKEAEACLIKLRGHTNVQAELSMMQESVNKAQEHSGSIRATLRDLFFTRGNRRALVIIIGLTSIQILCGSQAIIAYSEMIFTRIDSGLAPAHISIIFGVVQLIAAAFSASVVDLVGRRPLLLISVGGTALCNFIVGLYFFLERQGIDTQPLAWIPILAIMVFIVCYVLGLASVLFALLGEIFPSNLKAVAGAVYTITSSAYSFAVHKLFQVVSDGIGSDAAFWGFAGFGIIFIPFIYFLVPETKGKPLDQILEELNSEKVKNRK